MAFNSSSSIFGQKPATTSLFGAQNTAPKPQGSVFGNAVPNISGFGSQSQSQPAQGSSLFGGPQQQQQGQQQQQQQPQAPQPIQPPSLFGQTQQNTQQTGGSNLFGGAQQTQQNPAPSSFFSQPPAQNQPNTTQPSGFGTGNNTNNPLFGSTSAGSSLFSGASANPTNAANTGSSMFGGASTSANPLLGGQSTANPLFGNRQQSQQPSAMSYSTSPATGNPPFSRSTRFNDLPDPMKKVLEDIDGFIQGRIQISNDLKQRKLGEEANKGQELIREVHKDLLHTITVIQSDILQTRAFRAKTDQTVEDTIIATRIVDGFHNPQHGGIHLKNHADFPLNFFTRKIEDMKEKLAWCKNTIEAVERKLQSIASQTPITPQAITTTLEAQHTTFITLASRTAAVDAELQKVKALYTQLWRQKTGSMRDPFNELDRGNGSEFGLEGLSGK